LNCPQVSLLEWHGAYISCSSYDKMTTHHLPLHIGGWTDKLASVVAMNNQTGQSTILNVDGPYGVDENMSSYERIMIIAGGGGIAPCHAIFRQLHQEALDVTSPFHHDHNRVHLIWIVRNGNCFEDEFIRSTLDMVKSNPCSGRFSFSLYVTGESSSSSSSLPRSRGRPQWVQIFTAMGEWERSQGKDSGSGGAFVYCCGPDSLNEECSHYATEAHIPISINATPTRPGGFSAESSR
jgi:NAD(P)H-flavin reductase